MASAQLERRLTTFNATTINMANMVGIGPFIAIALILKSLGGPQAYLAWVTGTLIAMADGLVVAELGAALPAAGGTYVFLREGFGPKRWGRLLAFLFVWQILFAGPLEIASGNIGLVQYLQVFWPTMSPLEMKLLAAGICVFLIFALYRRIGDIARIMAWLWGAMLVTTGWVIITGLLNFNAPLAFDLPADAWRIDWSFFQGLGEGSAEVLYLFLGYYQVCYLGAEVRDPGRTIPRAVVYSVLAVAAIDILISFSFIGVVPWAEAMESQFLGATFVERVYGEWAAQLLAGMIVVTAFASIFALLLGLFARALRRREGRRVLPLAWRASCDQALPAPLVAADRRRRHHRQLLQLGERDQGADGGADPHPVHRTHDRAVPDPRESARHRAAFPYAALSLAGADLDGRIHLRVHRTGADVHGPFGAGTLALGAIAYLIAAKSGGHWPFEEPTP